MSGELEASIGKGPVSGDAKGEGSLENSLAEHAAETTISKWSLVAFRWSPD